MLISFRKRKCFYFIFHYPLYFRLHSRLKNSKLGSHPRAKRSFASAPFGMQLTQSCQQCGVRLAEQKFHIIHYKCERRSTLLLIATTGFYAYVIFTRKSFVFYLAFLLTAISVIDLLSVLENVLTQLK